MVGGEGVVPSQGSEVLGFFGEGLREEDPVLFAVIRCTSETFLVGIVINGFVRFMLEPRTSSKQNAFPNSMITVQTSTGQPQSFKVSFLRFSSHQIIDPPPS